MNFYSIRTTTAVILFVACLFSVKPLTAQFGGGTTNLPSVKANQMSDEQIMKLWQQAQQSGMSEKDAMNLLVKRGLPSSEVTAFKKRLVGMQTKTRSGSTQKLIQDSTSFMSDSSWVSELPAIRRKSNYYGYEFFANPNADFEPNVKLTTPKNYTLGPDDEITISYTGLNETSVETKVKPDGSIVLPYAGSIAVSGLTIEQATERIKNKMKFAYPALSSGKTQVFITVDNFKTIAVQVIGEADRPGTYYVSSLASFFNVLYKSGGPSENGSLRKIEIIRGGKLIESIDFYVFLQRGILGKDIRLEDQDVIRFPLYNKRVWLAGEVKRPAIYELLDKETLGELIQFGGGFAESAVKDAAKVVQMGDREMKIRDVAAADFNYFIPKGGDSVSFDRILTRFTNRVTLTGAVYRPGTYELSENLTLSKLIKKADGLKEEAFLNWGYIKRKRASTTREQLSFNTQDIISGKQSDITLIREDSVVILSKDSLVDIPTITIAGNVRAPSTFQFREGMSLQDAILMAGGFTNDAANHKVEISRLEKNRADTLANKLIDVITLNIDSSFQSQAGKIALQPLDYIFIPRLLNYRGLGTVKVRGEVLYAGDYALERRNETIQEMIQRSGGLSPFASLNDVQVFRNGIRVGTTFAEDDAKQSNRILLQPNDSLFIPRNEPFVEVKGAVFNPQLVNFQSEHFMSYISDVGGVTDKGNLKKAYIQYSNGMNRKIHHFLFFRSYPKVKPGSKIFVPEKTESKKLSLLEASSIVGSLATLIGVLVVLLK